jgi:predicted Zn-dependent protease with MMP-like domain
MARPRTDGFPLHKPGAEADPAAMDDDPLPPSLDDIGRLARDAVEALPEPFLGHARAVALIVEEFPDDALLDELGIEDAYELTGLYDGVALTEKSLSQPEPRPDTVWLFRRPILDEWSERGDIGIATLVAHVVIHEFAHHFGWSDAEIERIAPWRD